MRRRAGTGLRPPRGERSRLGAARASQVPALGLFLLAVVMGAGAGGCNLSQDGVRPPDNRIFFPGGAVMDPGGRWLYVVNSNSDLRYNAGTVAALDLRAVRQDHPDDPTWSGQTWGACPIDSRYVPRASIDGDSANRCCRDAFDENIINCDEQRYFRDTRQNTVRIGSFAARPVLQTLPSDSGEVVRRLYVPVRGDTSITMVSVSPREDGVTMSCYGDRNEPTAAPTPSAPCDQRWRISRFDDPEGTPTPDNTNPEVRLPDEPYALALDEDAGLLYVGHLRGGGVSLINLGGVNQSDFKHPELIQTLPGLLPGDSAGAQGITSLTIKNRGCFGSIYASSRYRPVVGAFVVYGIENCPENSPTPISARSLAIVGTGEILSTGLSGSDTRGIQFIRPGGPEPAGSTPDRMFILQRTPPALVALDAATQTPFSVTEVCQGPTELTQQRDASGRTVALFVTCFDAGEVYVVDPWVPRVRNVIPIGRGPVAMILPPAGVTDPVDANRAYVVAFGGNNVVVIDLAEGSKTQYHVIQRIGFPSATPREVGPQ